MNKPLLHCLAAAAAAGLGWLAGTSAASAEAKPGAQARESKPAASAGRSAVPLAWAQQIAAVRRVPGARAETAWIKWCFAIPDSDVPAAIAKLNPWSDFHALRCLYARWARLDPEAAWASFRKSAIPEDVQHFYLHEDENSPAHGLESSRLHSSARSLIASRMLVSMESRDPAAAKALAAKLRAPRSEDARDVPVRGFLSIEVDRLLSRATRDGDPALPPAVAAAAAARVQDEEAKQPALEGAARRWLQSDPSAACAWLQQLPSEERSAFRLESLEWALHYATPADRTKTLFALLDARNVSSERIERAGREGRTSIGGDSDAVANAIKAAAGWAAQDPAAAREWLTALPDGNMKAVLAGTVAGSLVRTDVNTAITLLNNTGGDQAVAVGALMRGWLETDARAALEWAGKIDDIPLRDTSRTTAALQLVGTDPALAIETARTVTDPAQRQSVFKQVQQSLSWNPAALSALREKFPGEGWPESSR